MVLGTLAALQQEAIYGAWLTEHSVSTCVDFQTLYEGEACCSSAALTKGFVVVERPSAECDVGWRAITLGGATKCAKLHATAVWTKTEANAACVAEGAALVMPKTQADATEVAALLDSVDVNAVPWLYYWIGMEQSPTAAGHEEGWAWDDGAAVATFNWALGQPTQFAAAADDGPEDCVLHRKTHGNYDFGCSPSARVVCMAPYIFSLCWGVNNEFANVPTVTSSGNAVCLKHLVDTAYTLDLAKAACGAESAQLYFPATGAESLAFATWLGNQIGATKAWINVVQSPTATDPADDWMLPTGAKFPKAEIPWSASDPEPSEPAWPSHDLVHVHVPSGEWQDVTAMQVGSGALCVKNAR